jgi:WD40 repeat protein
MIHLLSRYRRTAAGVLFAAALALVPACGSKDQRPLVLVDVPLSSYPGKDNGVQVTVTIDNKQVAQKSIPEGDAASGSIGIYLPAGTSGTATVTVVVTDRNGCVIAIGSSAINAVAVTPGERSAPVSIPLSAQGPCLLDGGTSDVAPPPLADASVADGPSGAAMDSGSDPLASVDALAPDGPLAILDTLPLFKDVASADVAPLADVQPDLPHGPFDVAADVFPPDALPGPEAGPDGPVDGAATTMNIFGHCATYTHSTLTSTNTPGDFVVRQFVFTPDGKNLISFGDDGRAKVWNITSAGLVAPASGLVFTGNGPMNGAIRSDGKDLAVGDNDGLVTIYDFGASIASGAAAPQYELPVDTLPSLPQMALPRGFTTDGNHLVVAYNAYYYNDPNQLAVWDLATQKIVRVVNYGVDDWPMAFLPADFAGSMWVASAATGYSDAGATESIVTLMDVAQSSPAKAQFFVPGTVNRIVFSPDGSTLAISVDTSEVGLWDITNKGNITRLGSPLVAGSASGSASADPLAFTPDGKYLAAGILDGISSSIKVISLQPKQTLQKALDYAPFSVAFSPDGLGLAVGEWDFGKMLYCTP